MAASDFFVADAKARVARAIAAIESKTAAEIVVTVRRRSGHYRHTDYVVGAALAMATLLVLLFHPQPFAVETMPIEVAIAFAIGTIVTANAPWLRRLLTSSALMQSNVRALARAAFFDMGIAKTTGRTGVLVCVSMLERRVEVVADVAVAGADLGPEWKASLAALERSVGARADLDAFLAALESMATPLARALPVQEDDVDELPNEPVMA